MGVGQQQDRERGARNGIDDKGPRSRTEALLPEQPEPVSQRRPPREARALRRNIVESKVVPPGQDDERQADSELKPDAAAFPSGTGPSVRHAVAFSAEELPQRVADFPGVCPVKVVIAREHDDLGTIQ